MALSPGFIFYGRYSIHEAWLLLFSMMFIFGLLGLWREGTLNYLWFTGIGVTGMILTKETYIIHVGCALIALPLAYISTLIIPAEDSNARVAEMEFDRSRCCLLNRNWGDRFLLLRHFFSLEWAQRPV